MELSHLDLISLILALSLSLSLFHSLPFTFRVSVVHFQCSLFLKKHKKKKKAKNKQKPFLVFTAIRSFDASKRSTCSVVILTELNFHVYQIEERCDLCTMCVCAKIIYFLLLSSLSLSPSLSSVYLDSLSNLSHLSNAR